MIFVSKKKRSKFHVDNETLSNIIIIILMCAVGFGSYFIIDKVVNKQRWTNKTENVVENTASSDVTENAMDDNKKEENKVEENKSKEEDSKSNKEIKKIDISDADYIFIPNILFVIDCTYVNFSYAVAYEDYLDLTKK